MERHSTFPPQPSDPLIREYECWDASDGLTCHALSPKVTAILIHETIGHLAEADFVLACAHQSPLLTLPPLSPKLTVVDYAHTAFGKPCPIPIYTDDEGTIAIDVCILKEGKRNACMTNRYTASALSLPLTGNARAATCNDNPMVRMRNTALLPWKDDPAKIISSIQKGFFLADSGNIYGDINGDFCCEVKEGYRIKNGHICERIPECMVWGNAADFLKSISMVGNDFTWYLDECTKWDKIQVAQGAPTIKAYLEIGDL